MSKGHAAIPAMATKHPDNQSQSSEARLAQVAELEALAEQVFGDREVGLRWLREPNLATYNAPPLDLLEGSSGIEQVKNLLLRIEYGVLA